MKPIALAIALMAAIPLPAAATLQIAFTDGTTVVTCSDGAVCDLAPAANELLLFNVAVGAFNIIGSVAESVSSLSGDNLQLSTSLIQNAGAIPGTLTIVVGDTGFLPPVHAISESASLTFNSAIGSGQSALHFFADAANAQPAGIGLATPGVDLFDAFGSPLSNPDSFAGTNTGPFDAFSPFSMAESAELALRGSGSITGFNESMATAAVPEPSTWVMMGVGFALLGFAGFKRRVKEHAPAL